MRRAGLENPCSSAVLEYVIKYFESKLLELHHARHDAAAFGAAVYDFP